MKQIKFTALLAAIVMMIAGMITVGMSQHVFADTAKNEVCSGVGVASGAGGCGTAGLTTVPTVVGIVVNILSVIVGIVSVIMIIVGGFRYVTSGGNDSNVASAKNTILYAIIGLIIVALAQIIVKFVLNKVTS